MKDHSADHALYGSFYPQGKHSESKITPFYNPSPITGDSRSLTCSVNPNAGRCSYLS